MSETFTSRRNDIDNTIAGLSALPPKMLVLSHLRWDFVFQRPQHLLTRLAHEFKIVFLEEPVFDAMERPNYTFSDRGENITVMVPHLPPGLNQDDSISCQTDMLNTYFENETISDYAFWYYTPMAMEFSRQIKPRLVIFDCMDELSAFKFAPESLKCLEKELLAASDIVFTGGRSLYESKRHQHKNIHPFPSSIDHNHFLKSRTLRFAGAKSARPLVRLGFFGVIDERFDIELVRAIAFRRPLWQIELVGPVMKIDPALLPLLPNIQYTGPQPYDDLPAFLATWDVALIPFLLNESTRFISPTKTPEYLAGGLPVISTPIRDVIDPYGENGLVHIASNADSFISAIELELQLSAGERKSALRKADAFLALNSWDLTCAQMLDKIEATLKIKTSTTLKISYV